MEFKLKSGRKLKLKDITLDERDQLLDGVEYELDDDGGIKGVKAMHSTITKFLRIALDGDTSDETLKGFTFEERTDAFLKIQSNILVGEEKASD